MKHTTRVSLVLTQSFTANRYLLCVVTMFSDICFFVQQLNPAIVQAIACRFLKQVVFAPISVQNCNFFTQGLIIKYGLCVLHRYMLLGSHFTIYHLVHLFLPLCLLGVIIYSYVFMYLLVLSLLLPEH